MACSELAHPPRQQPVQALDPSSRPNETADWLSDWTEDRATHSS